MCIFGLAIPHHTIGFMIFCATRPTDKYTPGAFGAFDFELTLKYLCASSCRAQATRLADALPRRRTHEQKGERFVCKHEPRRPTICIWVLITRKVIISDNFTLWSFNFQLYLPQSARMPHPLLRVVNCRSPSFARTHSWRLQCGPACKPQRSCAS